MIFRIKDNLLYKVEIEVHDEEKFVKENSTDKIKYIYVDEDTLPKYPNKQDIDYFYKLDENGNIIIDDERTLQRYKEVLIDIINKRRNDLIAQGFDWVQPSTNKTYHFILTEDYKSTMMALAISVLIGQVDNLFIIDANNNTITLTPEDVKDLTLKASNEVGKIYHQARKVKDAILNCNSIECVDSVIPS